MRPGTLYRAELLKNLGLKTNDNDIILDVGAFDGYWLSTLNGKKKVAIDTNIEKKYKGIEYFKNQGVVLPFDNNQFTKVFSLDVIEHIPLGQEKKFIAELIRVTKKNGQIILTTPSKDIKIFPSFLTNYVSKKWDHKKCNGYTIQEVENFLQGQRSISINFLKIKSFYYLKLYLVIRFLSSINLELSQKIIRLVAKLDSKSFGSQGYIMLTIKKK